jgi:signal transduction histidine kinase
MKLIAKYNRANLIAAILMLLVSSLCYYFILRYILINQLDDDLKVEEQEINDFVSLHKSLPAAASYVDQQVNFINTGAEKIKRIFFSKTIFNRGEHEAELSRVLTFPISIGNENYAATVSKSQEGAEKLLQLIVLSTLGVVILLLLLLFLINRFLLNKIWQPFYAALAGLKKFNLSGRDNIQLEKSDIEEFEELNNAIAIMTQEVTRDYDSLKNFTENASHEIQTPLAVIKSRLELLMQSENLHEHEMHILHSVYEAATRLSKLNQSLILLTKIENYRFSENKEMNISNIIQEDLDQYEELIAAKQITVVKNIDQPFSVLMNETLAEILVSNLITNAIKYNVEKGEIEIKLLNNSLILSNTGIPLKTNSSNLFERFVKDNSASDSLGLGLSIVKKICIQYSYDVTYNYVDKKHTVTVKF